MSELNNWLQHQEDEEFEGFKIKKGNERQTKAAMLAGLGLAVSLGAVATNGNEAKAEEQGQGAHDLLLCTYTDSDNGFHGTVVDNPTGGQDQVFPPDPFDMENQLNLGVSQKVYKGYILKNMSNGYESNWRIFKKINGQDTQVGILDAIEGMPIGLMTDSGVFFSGGKFYKVTDTGTTLSSQEIGELPLLGMAGMADMGGYIFANYTDGGKEMLAAFNEQEVLNHDPGSGLIPIASLKDITPPKITSQWSLGMNVDESTGELVIPQKQGVTSINLTPFLDEDGQLPPDFSLTDVGVGEFKDLGVSTVGTMASNGYKYHGIAGGTGIIMQTPAGQTITIDKEQLNGGAGIKLSTMYELVHGGIYIIFNNDFDSPSPIPPVVLHEDGSITVDPGDMTPFIKKCFVIPPEEQAMFDPPTDPCAGVTCPPSAEQCKEAVCDSQTGDCNDINKTDGTTCTDANACTIGDACAGGQCASGAPKTCAEPAEQCKQSAGCDVGTGNCLVENKTNGTACNDGDPGTENDKCVGGACEGTPIQVEPEPEPDVAEEEIEPNPESGDDADVVEQDEDIQDDFVEPNPETEPDVVEQDNDSSDAVDAVEADQEPDSTEAETEAEAAEQESDTKIDTSTDASEDLAENNSDDNAEQETGIDSSEDNTISADTDPQKKSPGCGGGCNTSGGTPETANGSLLLLLGGAVAVMRRRIGSVLASRK